MKKIALLILSLALFASARATMMELTATFSATATDQNGSGHAYPFSGSFTYVYDDTLIPSGYFNVYHVVPTTLSLASPVGSTLFDASNTYLDLGFLDGVPLSFFLNEQGDDGVGIAQDDFLIWGYDYFGFSGGELYYALASEPAFFGADFAISIQFTTAAATVPDAAPTALLLGLALAGLAAARRGRG